MELVGCQTSLSEWWTFAVGPVLRQIGSGWTVQVVMTWRRLIYGRVRGASPSGSPGYFRSDEESPGSLAFFHVGFASGARRDRSAYEACEDDHRKDIGQGLHELDG